MAVASDQGVAFDAFHLEPAEFDALLTEHGTAAVLRQAMRCACIQEATGQPDPACELCRPYGYVWDPGTTVTVFGPNRKPTRRVDQPGTYDIGDAFFTFPAGVRPAHMARLLLPVSALTVDDLLTKGRQDRIRFTQVVAIEAAHYHRRVAAGDGYTTELVPLTLGVDYTVSGRDVTWLNAGIADGTRYVLRLTVREEYMVWEVQTRNEGGRDLPYRALCKRVDYFDRGAAA